MLMNDLCHGREIVMVQERGDVTGFCVAGHFREISNIRKNKMVTS